MNILIPHSWLLENLATTAKPEEIQKHLSLCGPSVERIIQKEGEAVYDIEITTNRVDSMSVRGVAREAAVILNQCQIQAKFLPLAGLETAMPNKSSLPLPKIFNDHKLCKRIICVILEGVSHSATPDWMAKRLKQIDQNVHHAMIDITNYVTHELGHPCHAFDYDKIMALGGEIHLTEAQKGEHFTTLDGEKFITVGGEIVYKNPQGEIIDLPSIKGTLNTAVDDQTRNILLLLESIEPQKVRFASMTHAIRTTAAQLLEKGVDPYLSELVIKKAIKLYQKLCQVQAISQIYDDFTQIPARPEIVLDKQIVWQYLGIKLDQTAIAKILTDLECQVEVLSAEKLKVKPPTFRLDLETPVDLVEEVARIYGYHRLPTVLMPNRLPLNPPKVQHFDLEIKVKTLLAHLGVQELFTYSLVSQKLAEESGFLLNEHLKLQNPLTEDKVYLRRSLIPSLVQAIEENPNETNLQLFEIANIYQPRKSDLPEEKLILGLVFKTSYRQARGIIEALFDDLFIQNCQFIPEENKQKAKIIHHSADNGNSVLGEIRVLANGIVTSQLDLTQVFAIARAYPIYQPASKAAPVIEDLTFTLEPKTPVGEIITMIKNASNKVAAVQLKTIYQKNFTFTITYLDSRANLTNQLVKPIREKIVTEIEKQNLATLVGKLE